MMSALPLDRTTSSEQARGGRSIDRSKTPYQNLPLSRGRACNRRCLVSIQGFNALGLGDVGKCAFQIAEAMEDDAAIDVGLRRTGVEVDRQIEIDKRNIEIAGAIRLDAPFPIILGVPGPEAERWRSARRSGARGHRRRNAVRFGRPRDVA